ncbi:MAG: hypothetical protein MSC31_13805 [Solirubrobacteraceae bacterium MAG38_C4-C5]|nr:hypothetical protein [Candidatus Siliceabacter maunaloa]
MPNPKSWFGRGNTRALLISGGVLALFITGSAFAVGEGDPLTGGERNPEANQTQQFSVETEIIGDIAASAEQTGGYVTRQSNTQDGANAGGAAIYGCRSPAGGTAAGNEGCLRANNLASGTALEVQSSGLPALFQVGTNPAAASDQPPFATNGRGVVTNLNADLLDGASLEQIQAAIVQAQSRFVTVNAAGDIESQSGGFEVASGYEAEPVGASANVYIDAGESLVDNGIVATLGLDNSDGPGRQAGADANPQFSGEIVASRCGIEGIVACAPEGTNNANHLVVSPRNSDGTFTTGAADRKRFTAVVTGNVPAPAPAPAG